MKKPRVVVVGSSNTDMVVTGPRIPAPGETVLGGVFAVAAGGKGANQAVAAARLGAEVVFVARVGADRFGDEALEQCRVEGIDVSFIVRDTQAPTGIALIMVDAHGENAIAVASGANMRLSPEDVDRAYDAIATADVLMLQLEAPMESVRRAVLLASDAGVPIILNPAPAQPLDADLLHRIAYLTPNESETALLTGFRVTDDTTAARAAG
ncbi:MAG: ribokinase, partial [candidate division Zixibacteria bacterium]|nr:ribokinase [candidate division Zixibacteria bacterium]